MADREDLVALIDRLARFFFIAKRYGTVVHVKHNLSTGERAILFELAEFGPRGVPEMAEARGLSRQAIQRTVDTLFNRGFVKKVTPDADRRNRLIELTGQGRDLIDELKRREMEELAWARGSISEADLRAMNAFLDRVEVLVAQRIEQLSGPE